MKFWANTARQTREVSAVVLRENWDVITRLLVFYCLPLLLTSAWYAVANCTIRQKIATHQIFLIVWRYRSKNPEWPMMLETVNIWMVPIGYFRFILCTCFKRSLRTKLFIWKWVWWTFRGNTFSNEYLHTKLVLTQRQKATWKWSIILALKNK